MLSLSSVLAGKFERVLYEMDVLTPRAQPVSRVKVYVLDVETLVRLYLIVICEDHAPL